MADYWSVILYVIWFLSVNLTVNKIQHISYHISRNNNVSEMEVRPHLFSAKMTYLGIGLGLLKWVSVFAIFFQLNWIWGVGLFLFSFWGPALLDGLFPILPIHRNSARKAVAGTLWRDPEWKQKLRSAVMHPNFEIES